MKSVNTTLGKISLIKSNVVHVQVNEKIEADLGDVREFVRELLNLVGDQTFGTVVDLRDVSGSVSARAMYYVINNKQLNAQRLAGCVIANDEYLAEVASFIERYYFKHDVVGSFSNEREASRWLETKLRRAKMPAEVI